MAFDISVSVMESIIIIVIAFGVNSDMKHHYSQMEPEKKKTVNATW